MILSHQILSSPTSPDPRNYGEEMDISANLPTQGTGLIGTCAQTIPHIPGNCMCAVIVSNKCKGCADTLKSTAKDKALVGAELESPPPTLVDDTVKDNMDIDSGYVLDYGFNSSWQQPWRMTLRPSQMPMAVQHPHLAFRPPAPLLNRTQVPAVTSTFDNQRLHAASLGPPWQPPACVLWPLLSSASFGHTAFQSTL